jgi:hypothetical protein
VVRLWGLPASACKPYRIKSNQNSQFLRAAEAVRVWLSQIGLSRLPFQNIAPFTLPDLVLVYVPLLFLLLAGYENLTAPNAIMQS